MIPTARTVSTRIHRRVGAISLLALTAVPLLIAGCGSANVGKPTRYVEPKFKYSFLMPAGWSSVGKCRSETTTGGAGCVQHFTHPAGMRIVVASKIPAYTGPNGKVITHDPSIGCNIKCVYYKIKISGQPAIFVEEFNGPGGKLNGEYAGVNGRSYSYQIEMRALHHIQPDQNSGWHKVVKSFHIGKSDAP